MCHKCLAIEWTIVDLDQGWLRQEWVSLTALLRGEVLKQSLHCGHGPLALSVQVRPQPQLFTAAATACQATGWGSI